MLIYEVTLEVDPEIESEIAEWLVHHVDEMRELPPIGAATLFRSLEEEGRVVFVAHYEMKTREDYRDYIENHAERMRADGMQRFGGRFRASRRLLESA